MAFEGALRLGGVYVDVGLNLARLNRDLDQVEGDLRRFAERARVSIPVGPRGSGGGGGGGNGAAPPLASGAGLPALAGITSAISGAAASTAGAFRAVAQEVTRSIDGVIDRLGVVAKNTAPLARQARSQEAAQAAAFRAERGEHHRAQSGRLGARALGVRSSIQGPADLFGRLPSDTRYGSGIGTFQRPKFRVPAGVTAPMAEARQAVAPVVLELLDAASRAARQAAAAAGRTTRAGGYPMRPGPIRGRRPIVPDPMGTVFPVVGEADEGTPRRRRARGGFVDVGLPAAAIKGAVEGARRVEAAIASMGHEILLWFNRGAEAGAAFGRQMGRIERVTRPLRAVVGGTFSAITFPIRLALRQLGLFDTRVGVTTNSLRILGRTAGGMGRTLALPFRLAAAPVGLLSGALGMLARQALYLAPAMAAAFAGRAVMASANLAETVNKVRETFGAAAGGVVAFADQAADKFGLVKREVMDASAQFGLLLSGSGVAQDKAADMADTLTQRAADMSSFFNVSMQESSRAINSALRGQMEPISQFGAVINQAAVEQKALAMGLIATGQEMTTAAKTAAVYQLILEKTSRAHGDLGRTADSTKNLMRELSGRIENSAAALGSKLEPAFGELLLLINEVYAGSKRVNEGIRAGLASVAESIQGTIRFIRQMWQEWDAAMELMGMLALQLGENLRAAMDHTGKFYVAIFAHLRDVAGAFLGWFATNWTTVIQDALAASIQLLTNYVQIWKDSFAEIRKGMSGQQVDWSKFNPVEQFKQMFDLSKVEFKAPALQLPELKLPELVLPNTYVDKIAELIAKITATPLDRKLTTEAAKGTVGEEGEGEKEKKQSRVGELVGARELSELLGKSASDQERKQVDRQKLDRLKSIDEGIKTLAKKKGSVAAVLG